MPASIYRLPGLWRAGEFQQELNARLWGGKKSKERCRFIFNRWKERGIIPRGAHRIGCRFYWTDQQVREILARLEADITIALERP